MIPIKTPALYEILKNKFRYHYLGSVDLVLRSIYYEENDKSIELGKTLRKFGFVFSEIFLFPCSALSFYTYYSSDLGSDSFDLPMKPTM